ncbi:substrate-binding domain-containing protein, partial [bacterium]|nr:substrate-binding domain-containing protein [bacterium]
RIGYICGRLDISPGRDRLLGYRKALSDYGIAYDPKLVKEGVFYFEDGQQAMKGFIQLPERPTAVFAVNDLNAIGAMKFAEEEGLKVPQDITVVGFDDIMWSSLVKPSLTTIAQPKRELGEIAAELLLEKISSKDTRKVEEIVLEPKLIVRESSGKRLS